MLTFHLILAAVVVATLARAPGAPAGAAIVLGAAGLDLALGARAGALLGLIGPTFVFLAAALTLAATLERAGLGKRAADALTRWAGGSSQRLYLYTCLTCAALTAAVSLDGAIVLMAPVLAGLRRHHAPFAPLFLGTVAVANAFSIAVPQGNPTNLLIMSRLRIDPATFMVHMAAPGVLAAVLCGLAVAVAERRHLAVPYAGAATRGVAPAATPLTREERGAALVLVGATLAGWVAPLAGLAPAWTFSAAVAIGLVARRRRPATTVPWQLGVQIAGTVVVVGALHAPGLGSLGATLPALLLVAAVTTAAAGLLNNLPVSASILALLSTRAAPAGYAASVGLAVGSLATPQGSLATLLARQLAGPDAPSPRLRLFAPLAAAAVALATVAAWASL